MRIYMSIPERYCALTRNEKGGYETKNFGMKRHMNGS